MTDVSCGYKHSMALTSDGHVYTWGKGKHGRLGHDDAANKFTPARISPDAFGGARIAGIAAGGHHSAAVTASGAVYTWGLNDNAQLGDSESSVPGAQRQNVSAVMRCPHAPGSPVLPRALNYAASLRRRTALNL